MEKEYVKKLCHNEVVIEIDPDKIADFSFKTVRWDAIDIAILRKDEIQVMLKTCVKLLSRSASGEMAEGWITVQSSRLNEETNKWFLRLSATSVGLSIIAVLISAIGLFRDKAILFSR
jgi:hypothetical protein